MNWTELLQQEMDDAYRAAYGLVNLVDDDALDWRPSTGGNWMSTGQLLEHMATACGACCRGFLTGEWDMPTGGDDEPELPTAATMPSAKGKQAALDALRADEQVARAMVKQAGEDALANRKVPAPWDPREKPLGRQFLHMIEHLKQHKGQLFYYLKLQGKPVHTGTLYGA